MARQSINSGTVINDGTGDGGKVAFDKTENNFNELYSDRDGTIKTVKVGAGGFDTLQDALDFIKTQPQWTELSRSSTGTQAIQSAETVSGSSFSAATQDNRSYYCANSSAGVALNDQYWYPIKAVNSATQLQLYFPYQHTSVFSGEHITALPIFYRIEILDTEIDEAVSFQANSLNVTIAHKTGCRVISSWSLDIESGNVTLENINPYGTGSIFGASAGTPVCDFNY